MLIMCLRCRAQPMAVGRVPSLREPFISVAFPISIPTYFCALLPCGVCSEYVLGADGGTGHVEHANRAKAVSILTVKRASPFIWPPDSVG